ncbi:MAG: type II toxin-antitoxin system prevent-host-death family antitoxin [Cognatishimia sp.]
MFEQELIAASVLRDNLSKTLAEVAHSDRRLLVTWRGAPAAALVSLSDLTLLEEFHRDSAEQRELRHQMHMERFRRAQALERGSLIG